MIILDIPEDETVLALVSLRSLPDGSVSAQQHNAGGLPPVQFANALRLLADEVEIRDILAGGDGGNPT